MIKQNYLMRYKENMLKYFKVNFHRLNRIYCMDLRVYFKKSFSSADSNDIKEKKQWSICIEV